MKKWIAVILAMVIITHIGYYYIYQGHRNISAENPEFSLASSTIQKEFEQDLIASE